MYLYEAFRTEDTGKRHTCPFADAGIPTTPARVYVPCRDLTTGDTLYWEMSQEQYSQLMSRMRDIIHPGKEVDFGNA